MDQTNEFDDAELERLLGPGKDVASDTRFRQYVLGRTTHIVRGRRRTRRFSWVLGMAACYVAGLATMHFLAVHPTSNEALDLVQRSPTADVPSSDEDRNVPQVTATEVMPAEFPGAVLERLAEVAPDNTFRTLYRQAGDRYMKESSDVAAALRCYRIALKAAAPEHLPSDEQDNWLLASLKQAKLEEYQHANNDG